MKHIIYTPSNDELDYLDGSKDAFIFYNLIVINLETLTIDEFKNSFNDINNPEYLNSDYKETIVRAYLKNQQEFPNEDLMYFDRELSDFEKILVLKYSKNEKMIELLSQDEKHSIREVAASRKDLPKHIVDNLIVDPVASVRESAILNDYCSLSKEQVKLFAKETDCNIVRILFANQKIKIDDELIDYFVKNGSLAIKERLVECHYPLTDEQIEYLAKPQNSNLETKCILASSYKLTDTIINSWLALREPKLHSAIASRSDLTKSTIDIIIAKNKHSLNMGLIHNDNLLVNLPEIYQYAMSSVLLNCDLDTMCITLYYYIHNLDKLKFKLSNDVLQYLVEFNYKKGDMGLADYILQIPNIPQSMVERVAFDSAINYLFDVNYNGKKEYYTVGVNTPYFNLALKIKDYVQKSGYVQPRPRFY